VEPGGSREENAAMNKLLKENSHDVRAKKNALRAVAARLGVTIDERQGQPGFGPVLADIAPSVDLPAGQLRGTWHFISGLTHPSVSRSIALSDVSRLTASVDGVYTARMTANSVTVAWAIDASLVAYKTALSLLEDRSGISGIRWPQPGTIDLAPRFQRIRSDR
jgi:hypothetical protein